MTCLSIQEQLSLFSTKCQPIIKLLIRDVKETDTQVFEVLSQFLLSMIYESDYHVEIDESLLTDTPKQVENVTIKNNKIHQLFTLAEYKQYL